MLIPGEKFRTIKSKRLIGRLPPGYWARHVLCSQADFYVDGHRTRWHKDRNSYGIPPKQRNAIEVVSPRGLVVAAVGWYEGTWSSDLREISTYGTYVARQLRQRGIAKAMWLEMVKISKAKKIKSSPVSDRGFTLVKSMKQKLKGVVEVYYVDDGYLNSLKDLRGKS